MKHLRRTVLSGRMGSPKLWAVAVALALVAVAGYFFDDESVLAAVPVAVPPASGVAGSATVAGAGEAAEAAEPHGAEQPAATDLASVAPEPGGDQNFEVDASGKLVRNEQVRLHVEALVALTPPDQLREVALAQVKDLPAAAAVEALDLIERYNGYQAAQKLAFAPGNAPLVPEEALAELDGLHALRVSYFGREGAQSLFGKEEAVARQLLEWMRQDNTPGLTMEQRAMRAQARYDALQASQGASAVR